MITLFGVLTVILLIDVVLCVVIAAITAGIDCKIFSRKGKQGGEV